MKVAPPLTPDRPQVKSPPPLLQNTLNFLVFFLRAFIFSLLKRMVWLKMLYIQKSEELFLETVVFVCKT